MQWKYGKKIAQSVVLLPKFAGELKMLLQIQLLVQEGDTPPYSPPRFWCFYLTAFGSSAPRFSTLYHPHSWHENLAALYVYECCRFEKMISGMYMGEIVRLVLLELTMKGLLFTRQQSEQLFEPQRFYTKYISEIER